MIQVTDEAKFKLLSLMKEEGKDSDAFVRLDFYCYLIDVFLFSFVPAFKGNIC